MPFRAVTGGVPMAVSKRALPPGLALCCPAAPNSASNAFSRANQDIASTPLVVTSEFLDGRY